MNHLLSFLFFLQYAISIFGQDSAWNNAKISQDLSLQIPGQLRILDTFHMKIFNSKINSNSSFLVNYFEQAHEIKNERELERQYNIFLDGFLNSPNLKPYKNRVTDTSFSGTSGKWIRSIISAGNRYRVMLFYLTIANGHVYQVGCSYIDSTNKDIQADIKKYFQSINFDSKNIKECSNEFKLEAKSYRVGQGLGYFIRILVPAIVIVALLYYFYTQKMYSKKRKPS